MCPLLQRGLVRSGRIPGNELIRRDVSNDDRTAAYHGMASNGHVIRNSDFSGYRDKISQGDRTANGGSSDDTAVSTDGTSMSNLYQVIDFGSIANFSCAKLAPVDTTVCAQFHAVTYNHPAYLRDFNECLLIL